MLPYVFVLIAIGCAAVLLFESVIVPSEYYQLFTGEVTNQSAGSTVTPDEGHLPAIPFKSQWATLTVEGWERTDIPVFFGDDTTILRKGAGMWFNSRFCGQKGKTVLSAHVTSHFYEIEDTPVGALVYVNATYGEYVYKVTDVQVFHYQDHDFIQPDKEEVEDVLLMYTCYPRENGYQFKTERIALICKKVSGKEWSTYA